MAEQLRYTAARSSRINPSNPLRRKSSDSPFKSLKRKKPSTKREPSAAEEDEGETFNERLNDTGVIPPINPGLELSGVLEIIKDVQQNMFTPMPDRATGMSSTRVAEVLNFRLGLPPIVSIAHIHALSRSPTATEREISSLCSKGVLRRVHIPLRGSGAAAAGEGVALTSEWIRLLHEASGVPEPAKDKYIELMKAHPTSLNVSASAFTSEEAVALTRAGFLTTSSNAPTTVDRFLSGAAANLSNSALLPSQIAKAPSGSLAAIGGSDAFLGSGGGSGGRSASSGTKLATGSVNFSLPNTGPYLRLLVSARSHLVSLLSKASPRYREMPMVSLDGRWNGGVSTGTVAEESRKERGDKRGLILPGKTKKWRQFNGLEFKWVLEECVGAGMVEMFGTGSVGAGVRAT